MAGPWPVAFFGFQQSANFSTDARVLALLAVHEHNTALLVDGGHPGRGTPNWEMAQWRGLLQSAAAWPEINGAAVAGAAAVGYLQALLLQGGVYPDGVETEMASGYDMGTASDFFSVLAVIKQADRLPPPPAAFADRVEMMYDYGAFIADPMGCLPRNGDSDLCGSGFNQAAASYFNRDDWVYAHTHGQAGSRRPDLTSYMAPWAGQAALRDGWGVNATWLWFDVGPFGSNGCHAHRDKQ